MRVLLTNDDGIEATGLRRLRRELLALPDVELVVIAPDGDRSAVGRSITYRRAVEVKRFSFAEGGPSGYAIDGTPVDCVRLAQRGIDSGRPVDVVISGINHGANLGDDITYSGTVAAALEGTLLGLPAIAISQELWRSSGNDEDRFGVAARFGARLVTAGASIELPAATMLSVNVPGIPVCGVEVARIGRRIYRDVGESRPEESLSADGSGSYRLYDGVRSPDPDQTDTDIAAVDRGLIAVTPLHVDWTRHEGIPGLADAALERLLDDAQV